jgi:hypothetical protein
MASCKARTVRGKKCRARGVRDGFCLIHSAPGMEQPVCSCRDNPAVFLSEDQATSALLKKCPVHGIGFWTCSRAKRPAHPRPFKRIPNPER